MRVRGDQRPSMSLCVGPAHRHAARSAQVPRRNPLGKSLPAWRVRAPGVGRSASRVGGCRGASTRPSDRAHGRVGERRLPPPRARARSQSVINGKPPPRAGLRMVRAQTARRRPGTDDRELPRGDLGGIPFKPFAPLALSPGVGCRGSDPFCGFPSVRSYVAPFGQPQKTDLT
jgi:hypothetical protein